MTAVLPQEVADERLRAVLVAAVTHERMLELASDPPDVEHPVPTLHALQVDRRDVHAVAEQEVRWGRVTVQPDLPVLPHLRPLPPAVAQPVEFVDVPLPDAVALPKPAHDPVEVSALR